MQAYAKLFKCCVGVAHMLYGFKLVVSVGIADQAAAIEAAMLECWPDITTIKCYPHVVRNAMSVAWGLGKEGKDLVADLVQTMHLSRSAEEFATVASLACADLIAAGAAKAAVEAFHKQNCQPPNNKWYIVASGQPGTVPNQNPQESYNGTLKKGKVIHLRATQVLHLDPNLKSHTLHPRAPQLSPFARICPDAEPGPMSK